MSKLVGAGRKCQDSGRLFRLAGHLGRTMKRGRGRVYDGRVNVNHKLASRTTDAGRGELRKVVVVIGTIA